MTPAQASRAVASSTGYADIAGAAAKARHTVGRIQAGQATRGELERSLLQLLAERGYVVMPDPAIEAYCREIEKRVSAAL